MERARAERKEARKKGGASVGAKVVPALCVGSMVVMIVAIVLRGRGFKGGVCVYEAGSLKAVCRGGRGLAALPGTGDVPAGARVLHVGSRHDKAETSFTVIERANVSRLPSSLVELRLVRCGIEEVASGAFADLSQLRRLDLRYNRLSAVNQGMFEGLSHLEYLYLSNNPLQAVGAASFRGLRIENLVFANNPALSEVAETAFTGSNVNTLVINRCNLDTLHEKTFSPIQDSLQELYITHNMRPLKLPDRVFSGLRLATLTLADNGLEEADFLKHITSATEISLDDNPLGEIDFDDSPVLASTLRLSLSRTRLARLERDDLRRLRQLQELDLDGNQLSSLNAEDLAGLGSLRVLDVSDNAVGEFAGDLAASLPRLTALHLAGNALQTLPAHTLQPLFSRLDNLTLHDNPLHCNCEMRWFAEWLEGRGRRVVAAVDALTCVTPEPATNLTAVSDYGFRCQPPAILNTTLDHDGMSLVCVAVGDPPPRLTWVTPSGERRQAAAARADRGMDTQAVASVTLTRAGNYTCVAESVAGTDSVTVDTKSMPSAGLRFHHAPGSRKIQILETPQGFMVTLGLIATLGYIFRYQ